MTSHTETPEMALYNKTSKELQKAISTAKRNRWQNYLQRDILAKHILNVKAEYKFHETRKWRFDFAIPSLMLAFEIDGGQWLKKGGHTTGTGFEKDREKDLAAVLDGWTVVRFTPTMVKDGRAINAVEILVANRQRSIK